MQHPVSLMGHRSNFSTSNRNSSAISSVLGSTASNVVSTSSHTARSACNAASVSGACVTACSIVLAGADCPAWRSSFASAMALSFA